ncbi:MAG: hypothetical protein J2P58_00200 [Acidimicrobiaceae bacterium]|nr:hypothetical protein [Acidimicrobiaceae bacterium]
MAVGGLPPVPGDPLGSSVEEDGPDDAIAEEAGAVLMDGAELLVDGVELLTDGVVVAVVLVVAVEGTELLVDGTELLTDGALVPVVVVDGTVVVVDGTVVVVDGTVVVVDGTVVVVDGTVVVVDGTVVVVDGTVVVVVVAGGGIVGGFTLSVAVWSPVWRIHRSFLVLTIDAVGANSTLRVYWHTKAPVESAVTWGRDPLAMVGGVLG